MQLRLCAWPKRSVAAFKLNVCRMITSQRHTHVLVLRAYQLHFGASPHFPKVKLGFAHNVCRRDRGKSVNLSRLGLKGKQTMEGIGDYYCHFVIDSVIYGRVNLTRRDNILLFVPVSHLLAQTLFLFLPLSEIYIYLYPPSLTLFLLFISPSSGAAAV